MKARVRSLVAVVMTAAIPSLSMAQARAAGSTLIIVYVLFQLFLWNASSRLTDTTSDLRHVIEMSHDLAGTLDPKDVGHRLARHIAVAHGTDDLFVRAVQHLVDGVVVLLARVPGPGSKPSTRHRDCSRRSGRRPTR